MDKNAFLIGLSESDRCEFGRVEFAHQSNEQKVFSAVWALESQVNNGGFIQYFLSSDGDTASFAPSALQRIGAISCAAIVEQALTVASAGPMPDSQSIREALIERLSSEAHQRLQELDVSFFKYPDDLTNLLFEFVRSHPAIFGPVPSRAE